MSDDHGPQAGCNYQQCAVPDDAANCPLTKTVSISMDDPRIQKQHLGNEHRHDIPVEWVYLFDGGHVINGQTPNRKVVAKLRCVCGDEVAR